MKTPEQLKGAMRNIAKAKKLKPQEVLQMFLFERILERLSLSKYKDNFILKGGLLISSMIGVEGRSTLDMDTTVKGISMEEDNIQKIILEILQIDIGDEINFVFKNMKQLYAEILEQPELETFMIYMYYSKAGLMKSECQYLN